MVLILRLSGHHQHADDHLDNDHDQHHGPVAGDVHGHHDREGDTEDGEHHDGVRGHEGAEGGGRYHLVQVQTLSQVLPLGAGDPLGHGGVAGEQLLLAVIEIHLSQGRIVTGGHGSVPVPEQEDTHPHHGVGQQGPDAHHVHQLGQVEYQRHSCRQDTGQHGGHQWGLETGMDTGQEPGYDPV